MKKNTSYEDATKSRKPAWLQSLLITITHRNYNKKKKNNIKWDRLTEKKQAFINAIQNECECPYCMDIQD